MPRASLPHLSSSSSQAYPSLPRTLKLDLQAAPADMYFGELQLDFEVLQAGELQGMVLELGELPEAVQHEDDALQEAADQVGSCPNRRTVVDLAADLGHCGWEHLAGLARSLEMPFQVEETAAEEADWGCSNRHCERHSAAMQEHSLPAMTMAEDWL